MKKIVLRFGLIASAILVAFMFAAMPLWKNKTITFDNGLLVGYTSMVIALSVIFFGVKSYRDKHLNGSISFGKGLQVGLLITAVAGLGYAIGWEFYFNIFAPDFMDEYASFYINKAKAGGVGEAEVQRIIVEMDESKEMYKNPVLRFLMTMIEILPVGIIISVISAALLRKKEFLASQTI